MKKCKRVVAVFAVLLMLLSSFSALAESYKHGENTKVTVSGVWAFHGGRQGAEVSGGSTANGGNRANHYNNRLYWYEGYSIDILQIAGKYTPQYDGKVYMYCIHKWQDYGNGERKIYTSKTGDITDSRYWSKLGSTKRRLLQLLSIYGFPGQTPAQLGVSTVDDAYAATQVIAWEIVTGRRTLSGFTSNYKSAGNEDTPEVDAAKDNARYFYDKYMHYGYTGNGHNAGEATPALTAYNKIWADMAQHETLASFNNQTLTLKWDAASKSYKGSITDSNGMLARSSRDTSVALPAGVTCSVSGNTVSFTATKEITSASTVKFKKNLSELYNVAPLAVLEATDGKGQEMMSGTMADPKPFYLNIRTSTGDVTIDKRSADNIVSGMKFRIQGNGLDQTVTTNSSGKAYATLPAGTYTIQEIDVPDRYVTPPAQTVTITDNNTTVAVFNNNYKYGSMELTKTSEDNAVSGLSFTVTGPNNYRQTVTTDAAGKWKLSNLLPGTYTVTETTPDKYNAQPAKTVKVEAGKTAAVSFANTLRRGSLKVIKTFEGKDTPLAGVPFTVTGPNGYNQRFTTDENGEINIGRLLPGTYTATELSDKLTEAYLLSPAQTVAVAADKVAELRIHNILKKGYVEIYKTETVNNKALAGAVYGIYNADGVRIGQLTTDANGYAKSGLLNYGFGYYLMEESAPAGWLVDSTKHLFDITEDGATITIRAADAPQLGRIEIYKEGEVLVSSDFRLTEQGMIYAPIYETRQLAGAVIELYAQEDIVVNGEVMFKAGDLVDTQTTGADAPATFEGLYPGTYLYCETTAPDGFFIGANEGEITLVPGGQEEIVVETTITNERQRTKIVFWKSWDENPVYPNPDAWQGISFGLFASEDIINADGEVVIEAGSLVDVAGIDADGQGAFTVDLPVGFAGYVKELTTAAGYLLDDTQYPVQFSQPDQTIPFVRIDVADGTTIENKVMYGSVEIHKMSELPEEILAQGFENKPLAGAVYGIYDMDGNLVMQMDPTDEEGYAKADGLPYGRYYLQEITPPPRYQLDETRYPFAIGIDLNLEANEDADGETDEDSEDLAESDEPEVEGPDAEPEDLAEGETAGPGEPETAGPGAEPDETEPAEPIEKDLLHIRIELKDAPIIGVITSNYQYKQVEGIDYAPDYIPTEDLDEPDIPLTNIPNTGDPLFGRVAMVCGLMGGSALLLLVAKRKKAKRRGQD